MLKHSIEALLYYEPVTAAVSLALFAAHFIAFTKRLGLNLAILKLTPTVAISDYMGAFALCSHWG